MFGDQVKISFKREIYVFLLIALFNFLLMACGPEKMPDGILTEQQMVKVLTEMYLTEERASQISIPRDSIAKIFPQLEAKIFEKEGLSDTVFMKSMEYYKANPKKLENIYAALIDSLSLQAQRMIPTTTQ